MLNGKILYKVEHPHDIGRQSKPVLRIITVAIHYNFPATWLGKQLFSPSWIACGNSSLKIGTVSSTLLSISMVMCQEKWGAHLENDIFETRNYRVLNSQSYGFSSSHVVVRCDSWTIMKAECQRIYAFELWMLLDFWVSLGLQGR